MGEARGQSTSRDLFLTTASLELASGDEVALSFSLSDDELRTIEAAAAPTNRFFHDEIDDLLAELGNDSEALSLLEEKVDQSKNRIKQFMGDALTMESVHGPVNWKTTKPKSKTDWKAVAEAKQKNPELSLAEIIPVYTATPEPQRRLTLPFKSGNA